MRSGDSGRRKVQTAWSLMMWCQEVCVHRCRSPSSLRSIVPRSFLHATLVSSVADSPAPAISRRSVRKLMSPPLRCSIGQRPKPSASHSASFTWVCQVRRHFLRLLALELVQVEAEIGGDERAGQLGVRAGAVVALTIVLHRELPVALLDDRLLERHLGVGEVVGAKARLHDARELVDIGRCLVGEADEQEAADRAQVDRPQAVAAPVEVLAHVLGVDQLAGELVGPLVVGADELADRRGPGLEQAGAAVAADVVERPDDLVVAPDEDHRGVADVDRERVAGLGHVGGDADEQPLAPEQDLEVDLEHVLPQVEVRRQHVPRPTCPDELADRRPFLRQRRTIQDGGHGEPDPMQEVASQGSTTSMNPRPPITVNDTSPPFWHNPSSWKGSAAACRR